KPLPSCQRNFVQRNRQVAHALSGRVIDRICDCCCHADDADLSESFDAQRIAIVWLVDKDDFDVVDVGVHRHIIFCDVGIGHAAKFLIDQCLLVQRHADAPYHAAQYLAAGGLGVQDASSSDGAHDSGDPYDSKLLINLDL